jgi:hypothetical protein
MGFSLLLLLSLFFLLCIFRTIFLPNSKDKIEGHIQGDVYDLRETFVPKKDLFQSAYRRICRQFLLRGTADNSVWNRIDGIIE